MSLKDELKKSLVESAKAKDQIRLDTLRSVQSAIRYKEIDKKGELTDPEILVVISSLCKQRREAIDQFQKGGRADLVAKETRELGILEKFLPAQLSKEQIEEKVKKIISRIGGLGGLGAKGPQEMGRVMKVVMQELAGTADGRLVSEVVRSLLK